MVDLLHAATLTGATLLPLNWRLRPGELAELLRDSGARFLICTRGPLAELARGAIDILAAGICSGGDPAEGRLGAEHLAGSGGREETAGGAARGQLPHCLEIESPTGGPALAAHAPLACSELGDAGGGGRGPERPADTERPLLLLYTSGTTGRAKGVELSAANLAAACDASTRHLGVRPGDNWLCCLPLFHIGGLSILLRSVRDGSAVVLHERFDAPAVHRALVRERIQFVSLVPTGLGRLLRVFGEESAPPTLRCVLLGGAPATPSLLHRARRHGFPIAPTYGLTEAASQVATAPPGAPPGAGLTALPGTTLRIADAAGEACPPGVAGEIWVRSGSVMRGYWRRPAATATALAGGWLHTGDMGVLDAQGGLRVLDRRDDLIVSGGENIYPAEVEAVLCAYPGVAEAAVVGIADPEFGSRPVAWIVAAEAIDAAALDRFCRERLAGYKVPIHFHSADPLPRNASGKLLRRQLRSRPA